MKNQSQLQRQIHTTNLAYSHFTSEGLDKQLGFTRELRPMAIAKELIDNGLDGSETAGVSPVINIEVEQDSLSVTNNGSSIPDRVIKKAIDYKLGISDKTYYVSPTRGLQGNGLKCLFAAGYVDNGQGKVLIETTDKIHTVEITANQIAQVPDIEYSTTSRKPEKNVKITLFYKDIVSMLKNEKSSSFYKTDISDLVRDFALFNPHATFTLGEMTYQATNPEWRKWIPTNPTSPRWYTEPQMSELIAAYIRAGKDISVRQFISEFAGLSGTVKQKQVAERTGLRGNLKDFVVNNDINVEKVKQLLIGMKEISKPIKPTQLGIIGEDHMRESFIKSYEVAEKSFKYKKVIGYDENNLPYVIEIAFGVYANERDTKKRTVVTGLNFSATLKVPVEEFRKMLQEMRIDVSDPVVVAFHMVKPQFKFVDKGKTTIYV